MFVCLFVLFCLDRLQKGSFGFGLGGFVCLFICSFVCLGFFWGVARLSVQSFLFIINKELENRAPELSRIGVLGDARQVDCFALTL